jgi:S-adenosylmethionine hydrolase
MAAPLITLTTDFGQAAPYVAAMKGVLLDINPQAHLIDLSHSLPPQDLRHCSFFLRSALPYFPSGTIHLIVVDPGVGTERPLLIVEVGGQRLVVPDNGCWTEFARLKADTPRVRHLSERRFWRPEVSATFHGRDILAPVAGNVSLGLVTALLGPQVTTWVELKLPSARPTSEGWDGEVVFVDDFGNLITNLSAEVVGPGRACRVEIGGQTIDRLVRTYGDAPPGTLVTLLSSVASLEIAVVAGSAADRLQLAAGAPVRVKANEVAPG